MTMPFCWHGVEGLIIQTRNWGKTVAFWQALGYRIEFETGRNSGRLEHPGGGPYLFVVERPDAEDPEIQPLVATSNADSFRPPRAGTVEHPFTERHWGAAEMLLRDPDGRHVSVQARLPAAVMRLKGEGVRFRNDLVTGTGGKQIIAEDPSGNPVELFEPTLPEARLSST
jgi:catechol 2,3-dioxygenase-like lactoylglutathione lyase family enzyme